MFGVVADLRIGIVQADFLGLGRLLLEVLMSNLPVSPSSLSCGTPQGQVGQSTLPHNHPRLSHCGQDSLHRRLLGVVQPKTSGSMTNGLKGFYMIASSSNRHVAHQLCDFLTLFLRRIGTTVCLRS